MSRLGSKHGGGWKNGPFGVRKASEQMSQWRKEEKGKRVGTIGETTKREKEVKERQARMDDQE